MEEPNQAPGDITYAAIAFESALIAVALFGGWLLSFDPLQTIHLRPQDLSSNAAALLWGTLAAVPMFGALVLSDRVEWEPMRRLADVVDRAVLPLFRRARLADLAVLSLLAGIGEEMLFRGLFQAGLAQWIGRPSGTAAAIAVVSIVFGAGHALTRTYAVLAGLISVYLGLLFVVTGNLLAPIAAHAVYDFAALIYMRRRK